MHLLLLSNSTLPGDPFLGWPSDAIAAFLGRAIREVLFVPYAAVRLSFDVYAARVAERFDAFGGYRVTSVHTCADPVAAVQHAEAVVVGGGNTFHLIDHLHRLGLVSALRSRVRAGMPFIGWSAGANVACPTICTTNDMPVVQPPSFEALRLVPFQINPHFTDATLPNHGGETRADRLAEFLHLHPDVPVVGLPEGAGLHISDDRVRLIGTHPLHLFRADQHRVSYTADDDLAFLLHQTPI